MFCKFLVCHGFDLFFCQAMALLVLPEKKIHKEKKKKIIRLPVNICFTYHFHHFFQENNFKVQI